MIAGAGFKAGLKERLNLTYSRNLSYLYMISMLRETFMNKVWSVSAWKISWTHKIIIHLYKGLEDKVWHRKVCKLQYGKYSGYRNASNWEIFLIIVMSKPGKKVWEVCTICPICIDTPAPQGHPYSFLLEAKTSARSTNPVSSRSRKSKNNFQVSFT